MRRWTDKYPAQDQDWSVRSWLEVTCPAPLSGSSASPTMLSFLSSLTQGESTQSTPLPAPGLEQIPINSGPLPLHTSPTWKTFPPGLDSPPEVTSRRCPTQMWSHFPRPLVQGGSITTSMLGVRKSWEHQLKPYTHMHNIYICVYVYIHTYFSLCKHQKMIYFSWKMLLAMTSHPCWTLSGPQWNPGIQRTRKQTNSTLHKAGVLYVPMEWRRALNSSAEC